MFRDGDTPNICWVSSCSFEVLQCWPQQMIYSFFGREKVKVEDKNDFLPTKDRFRIFDNLLTSRKSFYIFLEIHTKSTDFPAKQKLLCGIHLSGVCSQIQFCIFLLCHCLHTKANKSIYLFGAKGTINRRPLLAYVIYILSTGGECGGYDGVTMVNPLSPKKNHHRMHTKNRRHNSNI